MTNWRHIGKKHFTHAMLRKSAAFAVGRRISSVCLSVRLSVCRNICPSQTGACQNGWTTCRAPISYFSV